MSFLSYPTTDTQKKILQTAGQLADTFAQRAAEYDWEGRFPLENFADMHRANFLTLTLPRELGGWGISLLDAMHAVFRLAQGDASTALVTAMHFIHTSRQFDGRSEYPPLLQKLAQDIVERGAMINSAVSEPATGSPSRGGRPQTMAKRQVDGSWVIDGRKTFTTGSHALHYFIVGCSVEDDTKAAAGEDAVVRGNFLVSRDDGGVSIEDTWNMLGMRGTGSNDLILDHVHVHADAYMEKSVPAVPNAAKRQAGWSSLTAGVYLGIAQAAHDEALRFALKRRPNSLKQSIATIPHIQEKIGKMEIALLQSKAVLFGLAEQFSQEPGSVDPSLFGAAKYSATNNAVEIVDLAMRVVGAASLALSSPLQRYYRDVRAGLHNPPMDDAALAALAKKALEVAEQEQ